MPFYEHIILQYPTGLSVCRCELGDHPIGNTKGFHLRLLLPGKNNHSTSFQPLLASSTSRCNSLFAPQQVIVTQTHLFHQWVAWSRCNSSSLHPHVLDLPGSFLKCTSCLLRGKSSMIFDFPMRFGSNFVIDPVDPIDLMAWNLDKIHVLGLLTSWELGYSGQGMWIKCYIILILYQIWICTSSWFLQMTRYQMTQY